LHDQGAGVWVSETALRRGRIAADLLPARLMIWGDTDHVRFLGWRGLGFRVRTIAHGVVEGYPDWRFHFRESVAVSLLPLRLTNWGIVTIDTTQGQFAISFMGRVLILKRIVVGNCSIMGKQGDLLALRARGAYIGDAGMRFQVTFFISQCYFTETHTHWMA